MRRFYKLTNNINFTVHLVYCESGIETTICHYVQKLLFVHLVYCESGIETLQTSHHHNS